MRRVRFRDPAGTVRIGEWLDGDGKNEGRDNGTSGGVRVRFGDRTYPVGDVDVLAPCEPTKIVCVGRNYADHAAERDSEVPDRPLLFLKGPNAVSSHGATVHLPAGKERIDFEAELGVVIDEGCRDVSEAEAMGVVRASPAGTTSRTATTSARNRTGYAGRPSTTPRRSGRYSRRPGRCQRTPRSGCP
jgi:hypothetical protein